MKRSRTRAKAPRRRRNRAAIAAAAALACTALLPPSTPDSRASGLLAGLGPAFESLDPTVARAAAPALAEWIGRSRDAARAAGVKPVPDAVRAALEDYVPADVLDTVGWCRACGDASSLQHSVFAVAEVSAVTLDDVVVFASEGADVSDPALWAHELYHVMQYEDWGVAGFAERYLIDAGPIEHAANEYRWQWMKLSRDPRTGALHGRAGSADTPGSGARR